MKPRKTLAVRIILALLLAAVAFRSWADRRLAPRSARLLALAPRRLRLLASVPTRLERLLTMVPRPQRLLPMAHRLQSQKELLLQRRMATLPR